MIEGLRFDVEATEMRSHLAQREEHHLERVQFYADKVTGLEAGGAEVMQYSGGDPVRALKDKKQEHSHKAQLFRFLKFHLVEGETYRLSESDLQQLEFIERVRW